VGTISPRLSAILLILPPAAHLHPYAIGVKRF
jgi:hypothetical protein